MTAATPRGSVDQTVPAVPYWEHFEHQADVGIRGIGRTRAQAFEQAAIALVAVIVDPATVRSTTKLSVHCRNTDPEALLVDWLNALVFEMDSRKMLLARFAVQVEPGSLQGSAWGEPVDLARHQPTVEVKGASYAALAVKRTVQGFWIAQCIVDV